MKTRPKFTVGGVHPLLSRVRDLCIFSGLELVPWSSEDFDFAIIGADIGKGNTAQLAQIDLQKMNVKDKPVIVLSTAAVYLDRNNDCSIRRTEQMSETDICGVPSLDNSAAARALNALATEHSFLHRESQTLILRIFNVYGPSIEHGVVHSMFSQARNQNSIEIIGSGFQKRSFLFETDFDFYLKGLVHKFVTESISGIYNVGNANQQSNMISLAKDIWRVAKPDSARLLFLDKTVPEHQWLLPNCSKLYKLLKEPTISLQAGLRSF